jgi:sugar phosphate isomerase/epimerase
MRDAVHRNPGSPRIFLAIDNCFAYKRWTAPSEWISMIGELGVQCIEASADTDADPLYSGPAHMTDWRRGVKAASARYGPRVVNIYSGHGTYSTLGLGHPDQRVRDVMHRKWIEPMMDAAADLGAGLGFFCHAFPQATLESPRLFAEAKDRLYDSLAEIAAYGARKKLECVGVEQMYSPHQIPWTIAGARELLQEVWRRRRVPFYLTVDTGHSGGQRSFLRPSSAALAKILARRPADVPYDLWLGASEAYTALESVMKAGNGSNNESLDVVRGAMQRHPYMFSSPVDSDPYQWLSNLGCYSPIIHLQQVTGTSSAHEPFIPELNARGSINARKVLEAINLSYAARDVQGLPPKCDTLYLTLEIFAGAAALPRQLLHQIRASVEYWRGAIPHDGMRLEEILTRLRAQSSA